ncbi:hypothetical protein [Streptomyces lavendulocolor]|uniref:hypothetical protein n=1 Tax=Streptomyces lavendulocolor TaxID=67316 RepID=UPI003C2D4C2A
MTTKEESILVFSQWGELLKPYRESRVFESGKCERSVLSGDPEALRCKIDSDGMADPCWSSRTRAACLTAPWDKDVIIIQRADETASPTTASPAEVNERDVPWALTIRDPSGGAELRCAALGGVQSSAAGGRLNWHCRTKAGESAGDAFGQLEKSDKPWTVSYNPKESSQVQRADVITYWP